MGLLVELDLISLTYGDRYLNIIHSRLRHSCALNNYLFRCNLIYSLPHVIKNEIFHTVNRNIVNTRFSLG